MAKAGINESSKGKHGEKLDSELEVRNLDNYNAMHCIVVG